MREDPLVDRDWLPVGLIQDWRNWLRDGDSTESDQRIRETTFTGRPCGDDRFVSAVGSILNRDLPKKKSGPKPRSKTEQTDATL